jgi:DnaJ-class molecular chaperone
MGSVRNSVHGRPSQVKLINPVTCQECQGIGWYLAPGTVDTVDWEWPCQACDTTGEVEGHEVLDMIGP